MMRMLKKAVAFLMVVAMLAAVPVATVSAEADFSSVIEAEIKKSITIEETTGNGLAFLITMNVSGVTATAANEIVMSNATVEVGSATYQVKAMGAVMANNLTAIQQGADALTLETVNAERTVIDVPARFLWESTADTCSFAVRIIKMPATAEGKAVACRPYCVLEDGEGNAITVYGEMSVSSYHAVYYTNEPDEAPTLSLSLSDVDDKLKVTASAAYCALYPATYLEGFAVSLALENGSTNAKTSAGDYVEYAFKDAEGNVLGTRKVVLDVLNPADSQAVEFYAPIDTASIELADTNLNYVPAITLPAIGSDIDVTKKKNRIRVSATSASFNEDGSIHVALTFKNYTSNWITEETDYVQYTYYDATGAALKTVTLYIGCIDTKKYPVKTFEFDVPATAASLAITKSKITYWTEWA